MLETRRANCGVAIALLTSKVNLADIQPENQQNVQKTCFWQKAPRVNGLIKHSFFLLCKTSRFTLLGDCLFSKGSQKMSKWGKKICGTLSYCFMYHIFVLTHFDVICDL